MRVLRRIILCFLILCFIAGFAACTNTAIDDDSKIVSPLNKTVPIQGEWKIEKCISQKQKEYVIKCDRQWKDKKAAFSGNEAMIGDNYWNNIGYKVKKVNAQEYLLFKFKDNLDKLGITDKEIYVITLSSGDKFLYEFVKINDNELIVNIDGEFFRLSKISDKVDDDFFSKAVNSSNMKEIVKLNEDKYISSGLLLGIRTPEKTGTIDEEGIQDYSYRTVWIAASNRQLHPILEADNIYLPRKSGFWRLELMRSKGEKFEEDLLVAKSVSGKDTESSYKEINLLKASSAGPDFWNGRTGVLKRAILFVGNDYVSVETLGKGNFKESSAEWKENRLQTLPVDNASRGESVKISDIAGENGALALESAVTNVFDKSDAKIVSKADKIGLEENFALFRKVGHWFIKGRVNLKENDSIPYVDYNINLIPPSELVAYDTLHVPWTHIKDRIPGAVDAYTSPNKDIALILSEKYIFVYSLEGEKISDVPLEKIALRGGDAVVMAEWATEDYVERWEKSFIKNNSTRVVDPD